MDLLRAKDVAFHYPDRDNLVVQDFSLSVKRGEVVRITGRNGSGKTTALKLIAGMFKPTAGSVVADERLRRIYMDQRAALMLGPDLTMSEHFNAFLDPAVRLDHAATLNEFDLGLNALERQFAGQLSGGQAQILALSITLFGCYDLLLLDEFTAHLDPKSEQVAYAMVESAAIEGRIGVVLVSHRDPKLSISREINIRAET